MVGDTGIDLDLLGAGPGRLLRLIGQSRPGVEDPAPVDAQTRQEHEDRDHAHRENGCRPDLSGSNPGPRKKLRRKGRRERSKPRRPKRTAVRPRAPGTALQKGGHHEVPLSVSTGAVARAEMVVAPGRKTSPRSDSPTRQRTSTSTLPPRPKLAVEVVALQSPEAV